MVLRVEFALKLMNAWKGLLASTVLVAAAGVGMGLAWNAGLFDPASAAEASEHGSAHDIAARKAEEQAFTDVYLSHEAREMRVGAGESFANLLTRAGAS